MVVEDVGAWVVVGDGGGGSRGSVDVHVRPEFWRAYIRGLGASVDCVAAETGLASCRGARCSGVGVIDMLCGGVDVLSG